MPEAAEVLALDVGTLVLGGRVGIRTLSFAPDPDREQVPRFVDGGRREEC